jgi:FkbM family methyltransferase
MVNMIDKIEDTLNGGYLGLEGEVVTSDCYKLKELKFVPEIIFDFGANVGIFSRYARSLFPDALIIAVEPHKENCEVFERFTKDEKIILINKAIGQGNLWHSTTAKNGAGESYVSEGLGFPHDEMNIRVGNSVEQSNVETIMPDKIINTYLKEGMTSVLKLDCEGAENIIWGHEPSMEAIKKIDYIAAEIHFYAISGKTWQEVQDKTRAALKSLELTHDCELDNVNFWATKKTNNDTIQKGLS